MKQPQSKYAEPKKLEKNSGLSSDKSKSSGKDNQKPPEKNSEINKLSSVLSAENSNSAIIQSTKDPIQLSNFEKDESKNVMGKSPKPPEQKIEKNEDQKNNIKQPNLIPNQNTVTALITPSQTIAATESSCSNSIKIPLAILSNASPVSQKINSVPNPPQEDEKIVKINANEKDILDNNPKKVAKNDVIIQNSKEDVKLDANESPIIGERQLLKSKHIAMDDKIKIHFGRYFKDRYIFWVKRLLPPRENFVYLYCDTDGDDIICNWTSKLCISEVELPENLRWMLILSDQGIGLLGREKSWKELIKHDWERADPAVVRGDENYQAIVDIIDVINAGEIRHMPEMWIERWHCEGMGSATIEVAETSGPIFELVQAFKKAKSETKELYNVNLWAKLPVGAKMHISKCKKPKNGIIRHIASENDELSKKHEIEIPRQKNSKGRKPKKYWKQTKAEKRGIDNLRTSECCLFDAVDSLYHDQCKIYRKAKKGLYDATMANWESLNFETRVNANFLRCKIPLKIMRMWHWKGSNKTLKKVLARISDFGCGMRIVMYKGCGLPHSGIVEIPSINIPKLKKYEDACSTTPAYEEEQIDLEHAMENYVTEVSAFYLGDAQ